MRDGVLRAEIGQLEADLARGTPLKEALERRALPELYRRMVEIGARSNDLPGVLTLLADHYHRANALWTRLKGLMVYPLLVDHRVPGADAGGFAGLRGDSWRSFSISSRRRPGFWPPAWMPPVVLGLVVLLGLAAVFIPSWRARLRWRLPAFREASLAQLASAMTLMLKNGMTLPEALALAEALETDTPAGPAIAHWRALIDAGQGKPAEWTGDSRPFPPLFLWLVQKGGEDVAAGFQKAAEIYRGARAAYRIELALYGALPVSVLLLGQMVFWQAMPLLRSMIWVMNEPWADREIDLK